MKHVGVALLVAAAVALPFAAGAQNTNPPACASTHYECSPGVCCPK